MESVLVGHVQLEDTLGQATQPKAGSKLLLVHIQENIFAIAKITKAARTQQIWWL